jgi:hypothetical protein
LVTGALVAGLVQAPAWAESGDLDTDLTQVAARVFFDVADGDRLLVQPSLPAGDPPPLRSTDAGSTWSSVGTALDCASGAEFGLPVDGVMIVECESRVGAYSLETGQMIADLTLADGESVLAEYGSRVLGVTWGDPNSFWIQDLANVGPRQTVGVGADLRYAALSATGAIAFEHTQDPDLQTWQTVVKEYVPGGSTITVAEVPSWVSSLGVHGNTVLMRGDGTLCFATIGSSADPACVGVEGDDLGFTDFEGGVLVNDFDYDTLTWYPIAGDVWGTPAAVQIPAGAGYRTPDRVGSGQPRLIISNGGQEGLYRVEDSGELTKLLAFPWVTSGELSGLSLTPNAVVGVDPNGAWTRSVGDSLGNRVDLTGLNAGRASTVASAARWVIPTWNADGTEGAAFFDNGVQTRTVSDLGFYAPRKLSGPYLLVDRAEKATPSTSPVAVTKVEGPGSTSQLTDYGIDLFGSLLLEGVDDFPAKSTVTDLTGATDPISVEFAAPSSSPDWDFYDREIWGDWIGVTASRWDGDTGTSETLTLVRNYRTGVQKTHAGYFLGLNDGYAIVKDADTEVIGAWDFVHNTTVVLDGATSGLREIAADGKRVAYPDYVAGKLRVKMLGAGFATSAPRSLGVDAPASFTIGDSWLADIDLTKALAAGKLEIRNAHGELVRSVAVPATASGSLRGITWDGKTDSGRYASGGAYTFTLTSAAVDGSGTVTAVDGTDRSLGSVTFDSPSITTAVPVISGAATVGSELTAQPGAWGPSGVTFGYQWMRDGAAISAATSAKYTLTESDLNHTISVRVEGMIPSGQGDTLAATQRTSAGVKITQGKLTSTPVPTVSGKRVFGENLTVVPGTWAPAPVALTYQWLRDGKAISGATKGTYQLSVADIGHQVSVRVTGTKSGYGSASAQSAASKIVAATFTKVTVPTVSGKAKVGKTLSATVVAWAPAATFTYQWLRNGKAISKATKATYKLTKSDKGKKISVTITGSRAGYVSVVKTSTATGKVK